MRLIDAQKLECLVATNMAKNEHTNRIASSVHQGEHMKFLRMIAEAKTIEAKPVVHGTWTDEMASQGAFVCSECLNVSGWSYDFCPHCGVDMRGETT